VQDSVMKAVEDAEVALEDVQAIGVAFPGQIDLGQGVVLLSSFLDEPNVPFVAMLQKRFPCHVALINMVNAYAIGEQHIGVGRQAGDFLYLHVGYSIGSSMFIDGKLYNGANSAAGEFGHVVVDFNGPHCSTCGRYGCLSMFSAGDAIRKRLRTMHEEGRATILADDLRRVPFHISSTLIAEAIDQEDFLTRQVVEEAAKVFGVAMANAINWLNPPTIILSGDVVDEIDLFTETAIEVAQASALPTNTRGLSIERGMLGTTAGAYGAAVYARQHLTSAGARAGSPY